MEQESEDYSEGDDCHDVSQPPEDESASKPLASQSTPKLACDICRHRKVRCDRRNPCSRCVRMDMPCSYTAQPRLRQRRPRVHLTNQYETKIDEISRKVDEICKIMSKDDHLPTPMGSLTTQASNAHTPVSTPATASPMVATQRHPPGIQKPLEPEHEGESSISAHTAFASNFLQNTVARDPSTPIPPELDNLRRVAEKPHQPAENLYEQLPHAKRDCQGSDLPLPPPHLAFSVLRLLRDCPHFKYFWAFELESVEQFSEYFFSVYSTSAASTADRIIVYIGLFWLFAECAYVVTDQHTEGEYKKQAELCRDCAETLLAGLPFHMPPSFSYVLALSMAATYSIEKCRPSLAWNFIGAAARMMHVVGGFGTLPAQSKDVEMTRRKNRVLTVVYMHDQSLCLRLGRPAAIGNMDIMIDSDQWLGDVNAVYNVIIPKWVKIARVQGSVYDLLYSPAALSQSVDVRAQRARTLTAELRTVLEQSKTCKTEIRYKEDLRKVTGEDIHRFLVQGERVSELSLDCLIHRNIPAMDGSDRPFSEECIALARQALAKHRECMAGLTERMNCYVGEYINWAILASPFVPFIALLCNVVETYNLDDLELLRSTVESIEGVREVMPAATKQLRLFQPLYEVASKYVEAKTCAIPSDESFSAFLDEMNVDVGLQPTLVSTLQGHPLDTASHGNPVASNASLFDLWSFLDTSQPAGEVPGRHG